MNTEQFNYPISKPYMESKKSFSYVWRVMTLAILFSPLIPLHSAEAVPAGVPDQPCGTLKDPSPGTLCYTVTPDGGKATRSTADHYTTIIQATEPEYVVADVKIEMTSGPSGNTGGPSVSQISPGGIASVVSVATDKLRELKRLKGELEGKATVLTGAALLEAKSKLSALSEQERSFEEVVTRTTEAGKDAGKFKVEGWAKNHSCGAFNAETCGSYLKYNIYVVRRYVGNPIAAYDRAFAVAQDAQKTIDGLIASKPDPLADPGGTSKPDPPADPGGTSKPDPPADSATTDTQADERAAQIEKEGRIEAAKIQANAQKVNGILGAAANVIGSVFNRPRNPPTNKQPATPVNTQPVAPPPPATVAVAPSDPVAQQLAQWGWTKVPCAVGAVFIKGLSADTVCINPTGTISAGEYTFDPATNQLQPVAVRSPAPPTVDEEEEELEEELEDTADEVDESFDEAEDEELESEDFEEDL